MVAARGPARPVGGALARWMLAYRFHPVLAMRVWQREVDVHRKLWPSILAGGVMDPIVYLLAMGLGLGTYVALGGTRFAEVPYIQFLAPGLIASSAVMAAALEMAWNTYMKIHMDRMYQALLATPAEVEDLVVGEMAWAATRAMVYAFVMTAVVAALGLVRSPLGLLAAPVAGLGALVVASWGMAYTASVRSMDTLVFWFTLFITPQLLLSGVFFPLEGLPPAVAQAAWFLPLHHTVEVLRALVLGNPGPAVWGHLAWLLGVLALSLPLPVWQMRKRLVR